MNKETYKKAKDIMAKIERFNDYIERVEKTDEFITERPTWTAVLLRANIASSTRKPEATSKQP